PLTPRSTLFPYTTLFRSYQAQLVQDKARQIELYGQRYRDVVSGVARAFEIAGGIRLLSDAGYDARLQRTLQDDPNLIALAICPVDRKSTRLNSSHVASSY